MQEGGLTKTKNMAKILKQKGEKIHIKYFWKKNK